MRLIRLSSIIGKADLEDLKMNLAFDFEVRSTINRLYGVPYEYEMVVYVEDEKKYNKIMQYIDKKALTL